MFRATASHPYSQTATNVYGLRQRLLSATLLVGVGGTFGMQAAQANGAGLPQTTFLPQANLPHAATHSIVQASTWSSSNTAAHSSLASSGNFSYSNVLHAVTQAVAPGAATAAPTHVWATASIASRSVPTASQATQDLNLNSATAYFAAGSLAGFHTLTINVGGKQEQVSLNTKLTAAELVAAQQVLSTGKQQLIVNTSGVATGGTFDISNASVKALDVALGGGIGSLSIGKGVQVVDSVASFSLSGSLTNLGSILVGATPGVKNQTVDVISAANITNGLGGTIASGAISGVLAPTDISLDATTTFLNNGSIHSTGNLNIAAASINNLGVSSGGKIVTPQISAAHNINLDSSLINNNGTVSSTSGNVNLGGSNIANLMVLNSSGTLQAQQGTVNFAVTGNSNSDTIIVSGGNLLSQTANFNAGKGELQVFVGQLTGQVTGDACTAHVTADTKTLNLGKLDVSGDPSYFNTGGDIVIGNTFTGTSGADLALVASGNIIGNGGTLDTTASSTNGGNLTLIAGANFTVTPAASGQVGPDTTSTLIVSNSTAATKGSKTGGYIDLSGVTYTGSTTNTAVTSINTSGQGGNSNGGNVLMVAYKGSGKNSGSIADTATAAQTQGTGGASTINAAGAGTGTAGNVTIIAPVAITGQSIVANNATLNNITPTIGDGSSTPTITIIGGTIQAGSSTYATNAGTALSGSINQTNAQGTSSVSVYTAGSLNGQANSAGSITLNAATVGSVLAPFVVSGNPALALSTTSTKAIFNISSTATNLGIASVVLPGTSTLNLSSTGNITMSGNASAGTINISLPNGTFFNTGSSPILAATNINLSGLGNAEYFGNLSATNFSINGGISDATLTFVANSAKTTNLLASSIVDGTAIDLTFNQAVKVSGAYSNTGADSTFTYAPTTALTKAAPGLTIAASVNNGSGSFNINSTATLALLSESSGKVVTATDVGIDWAGPVGSKSAPFVVNSDGFFSGSSSSAVFLKQLGGGAIDFLTTQSLSILGTGTVLNIDSAAGMGVILANTNATGAIALSGPVNGFGSTVSITAPGDITQSSVNAISGSTITLTSTAGSIGTGLSPIPLSNSGGSPNTVNLNAAKGSAFASDSVSAVLNKSTALNDIAFTGEGLQTKGTIAANFISLSTPTGSHDDIGLGASVGTTKTTSIEILSDGNIEQSAKGVVLTASGITLSSVFSMGDADIKGVEGIQTKSPDIAITGGATGVVLVNNTGNTLVSVLGGTNVQFTSTGAILMGFTNSDLTATTLALTSTKSVEFETGPLALQGLSITSPVVLVDNNVHVTVSGSTNITSNAALSISGAGTINGGSIITLGGDKTTSITLGKSDGTSNPLVLNSSNLAELEVTTKGNFILSYADAISVNSVDSNGAVITITASNIVNSASGAAGPLNISAANSIKNAPSEIFIELSGTAPVALGTVAGQIHIQSSTSGAATSDGEVSLQTLSTLTVNSFDFGFNKGGALLNLAGKTVSLATGLNNPFISDLGIGSYNGSFTLDKSLVISPNGSIAVGALKALIITSAGSISAHSVALEGATVENDGTVTGLGSAASLLIQALEVPGSTPVAISKTQTGTFSNFQALSIYSNGNGLINTGNLFTTTNLLKDTLTTIDIEAPGTGGITLGVGVQELTTLAGGSITFFSKNVAFTPTIANPALALNTNGGNLEINLNAPITVGQAKGNFDIHGSVGNLVLSALGNLTLNEAVTATGGASVLDATGSIVITASPTFHAADGSAVVTVSTDGTAKTSAVVNTAMTPIIGDHVTVERTSTMVSATPTYTNTQVVFLQGSETGGALNVSNSYSGNGDAIVQGTLDPNFSDSKAPSSINFVNFSAGASNNLNLQQVSTSNGNLNVVENGGGLNVAGSGVELVSAKNGNITLQNADPNGEITIFDNMFITAVASKAGLGNVTIAVGAIPTAPVAGTPPTNAPTPTITAPGQVFWGSNTTGTLTFTGNNNTIEAQGANVIFSSGTGTITVGSTNGMVDIHADPPVAATSSVRMSLTNVLAIPTAITSSPISGASLFSAAVSSPGNLVNSSYAALNNNQLLPGAAGNATTLSTIGQEDTIETLSSPTHPLTGAISHVDTRPASAATPDSLFTGATLIAPDQDTTYKTSVGVVLVAAKSVALILAFDGGVAVYNLHDTKSGAVQIIGKSGDILSIAPGCSALLTDRQVKYFEEINPIQNAAYRNLKSRVLNNGMTAFESQYNHASLLSGVQPLRDFVQSKDKANSRAAQNLLKTAAILRQYEGNRPYQFMAAPALTANNLH